MVDLDKLKLEFIPIEEVPTAKTRAAPWDDVFSKIPRGQALVLKEPQFNAGTLRAALVRRQKAGKWKNLKYSSKGRHGSATIYIMNTEKSDTQKKFEKSFG